MSNDIWVDQQNTCRNWSLFLTIETSFLGIAVEHSQKSTTDSNLNLLGNAQKKATPNLHTMGFPMQFNL